VAEVRERLAVNKQRSQRFHMEGFNLKKLKRSIALNSQIGLHLWEDLDAEVQTNSAWGTIREDIKISAKTI
jgi:hypothetical protein